MFIPVTQLLNEAKHQHVINVLTNKQVPAISVFNKVVPIQGTKQFKFTDLANK